MTSSQELMKEIDGGLKKLHDIHISALGGELVEEPADTEPILVKHKELDAHVLIGNLSEILWACPFCVATDQPHTTTRKKAFFNLKTTARQHSDGHTKNLSPKQQQETPRQLLVRFSSF